MDGKTGLGGRVVPSLLVRDRSESLRFYEKLGFRRTGAWPEEGEASRAEVDPESVQA